MTFSQFLSILKARWISALLVLFITVGTALGISLLLPKQYTASSAVIIDVKSPDPIVGMALNGMLAPGYMATQVDIITSDRVARRVVQGLRLTENQDLREQWNKATEGKGSFESWIAETLKKKLDVKPSRESNVINIGYSSPDPRFAAGLANAFVRAYVDTSLELRVDPAKQYNSFFDARSKELRTAVEQAQSKLSAYQKEHGILATDERLDIESQRLNELNSQLVSMQAISAESTSRTAQAHSSADQLQDVINNPVVAGLRADVSRQEARLQELSSRLGEAHPQVAELQANINSLRLRIENETRRVSSSVNITNNINKSREAEVRSALEAQRIRVMKMKEQRDEVAVLLRDVEAAQRAYDQVAQRLNQTSLESQSSTTNIAILTPATEPADPSSPKMLLNIILALFLGTLLGISIALLREMIDRRVRTLEDISETLGAPVIGLIPKPIRGSMGRKKTKFVMPANLLRHHPSTGQ
jgi:chain length determinant protein EpsF